MKNKTTELMKLVKETTGFKSCADSRGFLGEFSRPGDGFITDGICIWVETDLNNRPKPTERQKIIRSQSNVFNSPKSKRIELFKKCFSEYLPSLSEYRESDNLQFGGVHEKLDCCMTRLEFEYEPVFVDSRSLYVALKYTQADSIFIHSRNKPIVLKKDGEVVGVVCSVRVD